MVASVIIGILFIKTIEANQKIDSEKIINTYYKDISGFGIPKDDEANILKCGGAPTYGEMTFEGTEQLIKYLEPKNSDVFIDAGCGVGKVTIQFFFSTNITKSIGIELSKERYTKAKKVLEALKKDNRIAQGRTLEFYNQDILEANLSDATIFFMCSTCFSEELMKKVTEKLSKLKQDLRVITLKRLPEHKNFSLIHQMNVTTTWSNSTILYIYKLLHSNINSEK